MKAAADCIKSRIQDVGTLIPFSDPDQKPFEGDIIKWFQDKEFPEIYLAATSEKVVTEHYFCAFCKRWLNARSSSAFYIIRHHRTHSTVDERQKDEKKVIKKVVGAEFLEVPVLTFPQRTFISKMFKTYILLTGRPFSDIENKFIQELLPDGESAQKVRESAMDAAVAIRSEIKDILASSSFASVAIDEWADHMGRRFMGETVTALILGEIRTFTLALAPITSEHATAEELFSLLQIVNNRYNLETRSLRYVTDNCSTMVKVQKIGKLERFPCICHGIALCVNAFLNARKEEFLIPLSSIVSFLRRSEVYTAFCIHENIPQIPEFIQIRWTSLAQTISYLSTKQKYVLKYAKQESLTFDVAIFTLIEEFKPFFDLYQKCSKKLESDLFGTISYVCQVLYNLTNEVKKLKTKHLECCEAFTEKLAKFKEDFRVEMYPLVYAATILNPMIPLKVLAPQELESGMAYIREKMIKHGWEGISSVVETGIDDDGFETTKRDPRTSKDLISSLVLESNRFLPEGQNLFSFWKLQADNESTRIAGIVALEILITLCSSSSVEREFSAAGRFLTIKRMRLHPEIIDDLAVIIGNPQIAPKYIK
jgi:hypothetical protein